MIIDPTRNYMIAKMQSRILTEEEFDFDRLSAPPLYALLSQYDIDRLYNIASSIRYAGNTTKKYKAMNEILNPRGFIKLSAGTNRVAYRHQELDSIILKVAFNYVGIRDSPDEFRNQNIFKPFTTKVFEVSQDGTVGYFERVKGIISREEFYSIASDIFEVISNWFVGEYILADIGTKYFMNWGYRTGFGPVLLDFPYCYKLDGNKLFCSVKDPNSPTGHCGGVIDYDDGYNYLYCKKCGAKYLAQELAEAIKTNIIRKTGGKSKMKVGIRRGNTIYIKGDDGSTTEIINEAPKIPYRNNIQYSQDRKNNDSRKNYNNRTKDTSRNKNYNNNKKQHYDEKRYEKEEIIKDTTFKFLTISDGILYADNEDGITVPVEIEGKIYSSEYVDKLIEERRSLEDRLKELEDEKEKLKGLLEDANEKLSEAEQNLESSREFLNETLEQNSKYESEIDDINNAIDTGRYEILDIKLFPEGDYRGIKDVEGFVTTKSKVSALMDISEVEYNDIIKDDATCIVLKTDKGFVVDKEDGKLLTITSLNSNDIEYLHYIPYYEDEGDE